MKRFIDRLSVAVSVCLIIALLGINAIFVLAGCPNYTTAMSPCPNAPLEYNNGYCAGGSQICPTRGQLVHGGDAAYQLVEQNGSQIVSNSTPVCYVVSTCSLRSEKINGQSVTTCQPNIQTFTGYAYVSGYCSD